MIIVHFVIYHFLTLFLAKKNHFLYYLVNFAILGFIRPDKKTAAMFDEHFIE